MTAHATAVDFDGRHGQVVCSCGHRGPIRHADTGTQGLRRQVIADELGHLAEVQS